MGGDYDVDTGVDILRVFFSQVMGEAMVQIVGRKIRFMDTITCALRDIT